LKDCITIVQKGAAGRAREITNDGTLRNSNSAIICDSTTT
jgi:hypothetical protein